ncbi:patatin-like phospholipase family protein [Vibrio sp. HN007]|uniref:patatin-like phospholipase family protein n=1 Tax=Vibrio iocasae TaxID=3098914 RepID=UPI0035D5194F
MKLRDIFAAFGLLLFLAGCSSKPKHVPVPEELQAEVRLLNDNKIRYWGDIEDGIFEMYDQQNKLRWKPGKEFNFLATSGGGGNGAFSSGILTAWSDSGERPEFDTVTGISTGAIVAVFAYLGSEYDDVLTDLYTNTDDKDIFDSYNIFSLFNKSALLDTSPLQKKVRDTITPEILDKIGQEYNKGRLLLVGTTHLDSQRLSIWNMGEIAQIGTEESEKLFEDVVLASAAIPGLFQPVQIDVEIDGVTYQELHVDGGVTRQVFCFNDAVTFEGDWSPDNGDRNNSHVYVITNGEFLPQWTTSEHSLSYVVERSIYTIMKYQGRSDVLRIYEKATAANMTFNFAFVDASLNKEMSKDKLFDSEFMNELYHFGYTLTLSDMLWHDKPPGFNNVTPSQDLRF